MVASIVTLLAIGIAAGAGTHRNRFRLVRRARQQPRAVGRASPTGPVNRDAARYRSSDPPFSPVRQEPGSISIAGNAKAHHRQRSLITAN